MSRSETDTVNASVALNHGFVIILMIINSATQTPLFDYLLIHFVNI